MCLGGAQLGRLPTGPLSPGGPPPADWTEQHAHDSVGLVLDTLTLPYSPRLAHAVSAFVDAAARHEAFVRPFAVALLKQAAARPAPQVRACVLVSCACVVCVCCVRVFCARGS